MISSGHMYSLNDSLEKLQKSNTEFDISTIFFMNVLHM